MQRRHVRRAEGVDADASEPLRHPGRVRVPREDASLEDPHHLVDAVTEDETPVVRGDERFRFGNKAAVEVDDRHRAAPAQPARAASARE